MRKFELVLRNEKLKLYNRFSIFIIIILTLLYVYISFFTQNSTSGFLKISVLALMALVVLVRFFFRNIKYTNDLKILFIFLIMGWAYHKLYWLAGATFLLGIMFSYVTKVKTVCFSELQIVYPSFPRKKISWNKLNNAILKDGLLTIDLKNNKLIQQFIDAKNAAIDEKEFNEFCRQQLTTSNQQQAT